jgi:hypothetical protein
MQTNRHRLIQIAGSAVWRLLPCSFGLSIFPARNPVRSSPFFVISFLFLLSWPLFLWVIAYRYWTRGKHVAGWASCHAYATPTWRPPRLIASFPPLPCPVGRCPSCTQGGMHSGGCGLGFLAASLLSKRECLARGLGSPSAFPITQDHQQATSRR